MTDSTKAGISQDDRKEDYTYLEPYEKITMDTRYHGLDATSAFRSPEEWKRKKRNEQTLYIVSFFLLLAFFFLFYFVVAPGISSLDNPLVYAATYVVILLIPAIALLYLFIRWALYRRHSRRMREEYEAEVKARGIREGKSSEKNLCNACLRLVPDSARNCPFCGAEMDIKKQTIEPAAERVSAREAIRRLGDYLYFSLVSSVRLVPVVLILILILGLVFGLTFGVFLNHFGSPPTTGFPVVQSVVLWGSFVTGCICVMRSTSLPIGTFVSFPYVWRFTVPVGRKESANELDMARFEWLVMAGFCLLIFMIGLLLPF